MGLNLLERIQAKIELFRLEQRYTRRRNRRSTFVSNAVYVDGEYIYQSPNTTGSSSASASTTRSASIATNTTASATSSPTSGSSTPRNMPAVGGVEGSGVGSVSKTQKRLNRWSSMPGFGSSLKMEGAVGGGNAMPTVREREEAEWRRRVSFGDDRGY